MNLTLGVFAHVDAGKTTFCESLLYQMKQIRTWGRVDYKNTLMDHDELERRRGITIFTDIASFEYEGDRFYLIDTPGHTDFSAEMERALSVLDGAILLINAADGVQSHTLQVYRMLRARRIPIYFFINKLDQAGTDRDENVKEIRDKLTPDFFFMETELDWQDDVFAEWLCDYDEQLMERYLEGTWDPGFVQKVVRELVCSQRITLTFGGSALHQMGVLPLLRAIHLTLLPFFHDFEPVQASEAEEPFGARVFKVGYDERGSRITFIKCLGGSLQVKDEVSYIVSRLLSVDVGAGDSAIRANENTEGSSGKIAEKIHEIREYQGKTYKGLQRIEKGQIAAVIGLTEARAGMGLGVCNDLPETELKPALQATVLKNGEAHDKVMACLRRLEAQDPLLSVCREPQTGEISVHIMGTIQLEILREIMRGKYGLQVDFGPYKVVYKETVAKPVTGYGHFEPLRHYAEVHLRIEPNPGGGIAFESRCSVDEFPRQHQNMVRHSLLSRDHKGVLTGSSLTDVRFILLRGAHHLLHTEGGDLREASWRAARQGLEKADSVLLEPYYAFHIDVNIGVLGRVLSDLTRLHGRFDPPKTVGSRAVITGEGPVETFAAYGAELLSFTKGEGAISLAYSGYAPCHDPQRIIESIGYEKERDLMNVSSSVFCRKGAGFEVKWKEAEAMMHLPLEG